jgi:hypothetical protein
VQDKDDIVNVKLNAFEDGFIKWIMSQPTDLVHIIQPTSVKEKIINKANRLLEIYMEGQKDGEEN